MEKQREIKFRAWSIDDKIMISPLSPVWFEENYYQDDDFARCAEIENHILMQYTGLKDKNGTEIYEGDIVWDEYNELHCSIYFDQGCFSVKVDNIVEMLAECADSCFVAGNIYENPELLDPTPPEGDDHE